MEQPATTAHPAGSPTFAGLLAAFTAPAQKHKNAWDDDDIEDDVVSLSYEHAWGAHSRCRLPEGPTDGSPSSTVNAESLRIFEVVPDGGFPVEALSNVLISPDGEQPARTVSANHAYVSRQDAAVETSPGASYAPDRNLKSASITIRLSVAECLQLRKRAGEAGLTVSAYLRSCTFEAESLRSLVKDTLAKLRSEGPAEKQCSSAPGGHTLRQRLAQFWPLS